jgi:hypothetical protein
MTAGSVSSDRLRIRIAVPGRDVPLTLKYAVEEALTLIWSEKLLKLRERGARCGISSKTSIPLSDQPFDWTTPTSSAALSDKVI